MVRHSEQRGPPAVKRGAPEKSQRIHGSALLEAMSMLGSGSDADDNSARLEKDATDAIIARRNAPAKHKYFDLKALKQEDDGAVSAVELKAALDEWKAEICKPAAAAASASGPGTGEKRKRPLAAGASSAADRDEEEDDADA
jgi:hypothetical protein